MYALINPDTPEEIIRSLIKRDISPLPIENCIRVDKPIAGHPDLQFFINDGNFFCHPHISTDFLRKIDNLLNIVICDETPGATYPEDIAYNIVCTGSVALHRTDKTPVKIKEYLKSKNIPLVNINQGYSKCSTLVVDENNIISADRKLCKAARDNNLNSLEIRAGFIHLPGYPYGFIGGASGATREHIIFTGDISFHPDSEKIIDFIEKTGKKIIFLSDKPPIDLGTIFFI